MEIVAAERLNKIGIRDHNIANRSDSDNEATSISQDAQDMSAIVSALAHQQSDAESDGSESDNANGMLVRRRGRKGQDNPDITTTKTTSDPSSLHLVAKDLHQVGRLIIKTTNLLPRPRSESCFSTIDSDEMPDRPLKRSPKKEVAMNMLNLPLNPLKKKKTHHVYQPKSEAVFSPSVSDNADSHHAKSHLKISLKTPPAVLTQPSSSLYPGAVKSKQKNQAATPLTSVPPPPPPGTLPGYFLPPSSRRQHHTPAGTPTTSPSSVTHHLISHHRRK